MQTQLRGLGLALALTSSSWGEQILDFPSEDSQVFNAASGTTSPLGMGCGGVLYVEGSSITETFGGGVLCEGSASEWDFFICNDTVGVLNTFDVFINDVLIGSYDFNASAPGVIHFGLNFDHGEPIAGGSYTLKMVATSTVPPLMSSWNWTAGTPACPSGTVAVRTADVNGDGTVNVLDLIDLLLCFGLPATEGCEAEDINSDNIVNVLDLIDLLLAFGTACP